MKSKLPILAVLLLSSTVYCRAGLFDKINNAISTTLPVASTNPPAQEPAANQPDQSSQVANTNTTELKGIEQPNTPQPSDVGAAPQTNNLEPQSEQAANASPQNIKAYKTLNFGDNTKTVKQKLDGIVVDASEEYDKSGISITFSDQETLESALFDTEAEYEASKTPYTLYDLMNSLNETGVSDAVHYKNSAMSVDCYQLNKSWNDEKNGDLAIVEVCYNTFDPSNIVEAFMRNYPNATKEIKPYRIESKMFPGIFLECERTYLSDINTYRRARLSIPTRKFAFAFTELSKLSKEQLATWQGAMTTAGNTSQIDEYFESVKTVFLKLTKDMESAGKLDDYSLTLLGWDNIGNYESIIYGTPSVIFASKQILDPFMNDYRQSIEAKDQAEKEKLKKEAGATSGF